MRTLYESLSLFIYLTAVIQDIGWSVIAVQIILCGEQDITL
jgi:hypothetical protein